MAADQPAALLADRFGRRIDYLRISVTDRCDLRCSYCMPKGYCGFEEPANWLGFDEIERLVAVFGKLGVHRLRITGGEPLLRRNLPRLIETMPMGDTGRSAQYLDLQPVRERLQARYGGDQEGCGELRCSASARKRFPGGAFSPTGSCG